MVHYESGHAVPMPEFNADVTDFISDALEEPRPKTPKNMVD